VLTLYTSNPKKYAPFQALLNQLGIVVEVPRFELPEPQHRDFAYVLTEKARCAAETSGRPCLVDDSGLLLDAYPGFPGPLTKHICECLGAVGFERLLNGVSRRGRLQCHLGFWRDGRLRHWQGEATGTLDPSRAKVDGPGLLTAWFVPDQDSAADGIFAHRRRALEALAHDIAHFGPDSPPPFDDGDTGSSEPEPHPGCVFCVEFADDPSCIFRQIAGREIANRVIHQTPHFLAFPPLGQFVEGGLLLCSKAHFLSCGHLPDPYYEELEYLVAKTTALLHRHYGCYPLIFEHAPRSAADKGTCCVDHAHLNVFPVVVDVHRHLEQLPHTRIRCFGELRGFRQRRQPYLFLQANSGQRFAYEVEVVPSQHIRKIITAELGMADRWHWRDYLGLEELKRTINTLSDWR
jgi:inosine/xanthosine triphosphate pyrophosphatase family protein/diadenosine tetraphosphate (Ap4A) HIT family hydrolase